MKKREPIDLIMNALAITLLLFIIAAVICVSALMVHDTLHYIGVIK